MALIFKSKLYRDEIKHWALMFVLLAWAILASYFALRNESKTILIGIDESGSRIISETSDRILKSELKNFLKSFLENYYNYDEKNYSAQMGFAADYMSKDLWENQKPKLIEIKSKLEKVPLSQTSEIESLDLIDQNKVEGILILKVKSKINEQIVKLKISLNFSKAPRTETNPWGYEIQEISDVML